MNTTAPSLPAKELTVLQTIRRHGRVYTRIKETGDGDREYLQPSANPEHKAEAPAIREDDVLTCLHSLEGRGLVVCTMHVHPWSATEYICEWKLCDG